ncbi:leucine--tRNA ligase [Dehalococcoidia bacterium]|nr:leucine--tRNA ligase [Dehalococcoidia bacterium]
MANQSLKRYYSQDIDIKWQNRWSEDKIYLVSEKNTKPKWYELTMYPYPSGDLHIGHWYAMAPADAHARFRRMQGYNVLHPMGFDAFGLPAENAAIKRGIHPYKWTMNNIENMRGQLKSMGTIYDWQREIICALPEYYKWSQWLFLKLYHAGLAYRGSAPANWCPSCQTVLANEQVKEGRCERCDTAVIRKDLEQWFFEITKYADELMDFSGLIDWPEKIKTMQTNWIGRSEGVEIEFDISGAGLKENKIKTFTTRIDTIFGVTFIVMAPEHPLVENLVTEEHRREVEDYIDQARRQTEVERLSTEHEKTGVFIGAYATNNLNNQHVPIFIADYALLSYGTGIVMGVPAHDQRDFDFAKKYNLPIKLVVAPEENQGRELHEAYPDEGIMVNSGQFDGTSSKEAKTNISKYVESQGLGKRTHSYRIRDWLISRQRYWGTPIPVVYCEACGVVPVPEEDLPVLLPEDAQFKPTGESPLKYHAGFLLTKCPRCKHDAQRETDTMDTFVDSSWYHLRYIDPNYSHGPIDKRLEKKWLPVDQYTGGAEHAVMHLLYARFFNKAMRDIGLVHYDEPYLRLFNQGTIIAQKAKMSKSRGNVIAPDPYVEEFGADVVRTYLMFLGPWDQGGEWSDTGINGMARWLNRVWELATHSVTNNGNEDKLSENDHALLHNTHKTIRRVHGDLERFKFNTAIAAMMELTNFMGRIRENKDVSAHIWNETIEKLLLMLAPIAPHLTEELWAVTRHSYSIHNELFPLWDDDVAKDQDITLIIQVDGKLRDRIEVPSTIEESDAKQLALASPKIVNYMAGKTIKHIIYVPGRLVNLVLHST